MNNLPEGIDTSTLGLLRLPKRSDRRFAIIFEDGTIGHADAVKALQDGEWKDIAFPDMQRKAHMTIIENVVRI